MLHLLCCVLVGMRLLLLVRCLQGLWGLQVAQQSLQPGGLRLVRPRLSRRLLSLLWGGHSGSGA